MSGGSLSAYDLGVAGYARLFPVFSADNMHATSDFLKKSGGRLVQAFQDAAQTERGAALVVKAKDNFDFFTQTKRGGIIGNILMGGAQGALAFANGESAFKSAEIAIGEAIPYAEAAIAVTEGDKKEAAVSAIMDTAQIGGTLAGAAAGAAMGSVVPFVGTAVGGVIGGFIGSGVADWGTSWVLKENPKLADNATFCLDVGLDFANSATNQMCSFMSKFPAGITALPVFFTNPVLASTQFNAKLEQ